MVKDVKDFVGGFRGFLLNKVNRPLLVTVSLFTIISSLLYSYSIKISQDVLYEQMLHREQIVARAGSFALENFFGSLSDQLETYVQKSDVSKIDDSTVKDLVDFISIWSEDKPVEGILILDKEGKIVANDRSDTIGDDLKTIEYFKVLKESSKARIFLSKPFVDKIGEAEKQVVVVASPIIKDGEFKGVLAVNVSIDGLAEKYLTPLKLAEENRIYLINDEGVIISSPVRELIGVNYLNFIRNSGVKDTQRVIELFNKAFEDGTESKLDMVLPQPSKNGFVNTRYLAAESPVTVGDQTISLSVSIPASYALEFLGPLFRITLGILIFCLATILCLGAANLKAIKKYRNNI